MDIWSLPPNILFVRVNKSLSEIEILSQPLQHRPCRVFKDKEEYKWLQIEPNI